VGFFVKLQKGDKDPKILSETDSRYLVVKEGNVLSLPQARLPFWVLQEDSSYRSDKPHFHEGQKVPYTTCKISSSLDLYCCPLLATRRDLPFRI
jgi:hypothetical protein